MMLFDLPDGEVHVNAAVTAQSLQHLNGTRSDSSAMASHTGRLP